MKNKPELEPIVAPRYELKDGYLTITVNTYNSSTEKPKYVIKRISRSNLNDFIKLYELLIEEYVYYNFEIGSIIATDRGWQLLKDIAKLVPVIKNGDKVALDIEELEDDYEMITMLFLTEDVTEEGVGTSPEPGLKSSLLSRLNHLDQQSLLGKAMVKVRERKAEEILAVTKLEQEIKAMSQPAETTTPITSPSS